MIEKKCTKYSGDKLTVRGAPSGRHALGASRCSRAGQADRLDVVVERERSGQFDDDDVVRTARTVERVQCRRHAGELLLYRRFRRILHPSQLLSTQPPQPQPRATFMWD